MSLTRAYWLRSLLAGLAMVVAPAGTSSLWAQGADPFRPYNRQYDPYTVPQGPPAADAGQFVGGLPRSGVRGANQYQNFLGELQGGTRDGNGIGVPYYRSSVDPRFDPDGKREYRPNLNADRTFEQSQELVTRKYLAYFSERDPKKRAALLKEYNQTRGKVARALSSRRDNNARSLETAATDRGRRSPASVDGTPRTPSTDRAARSNDAESPRRGVTSAIPEPPPLFGAGEGSIRGGRPTRSPEDVLNRSRRLNSGADTKAGRGASAGTRPSTDRRPLNESPPPE